MFVSALPESECEVEQRSNLRLCEQQHRTRFRFRTSAFTTGILPFKSRRSEETAKLASAERFGVHVPAFHDARHLAILRFLRFDSDALDFWHQIGVLQLLQCGQFSS